MSDDLLTNSNVYNMFFMPSNNAITVHEGDENSAIVFYGDPDMKNESQRYYVRKYDQGPVLSFVHLGIVTNDRFVGLESDLSKAPRIVTKGLFPEGENKGDDKRRPFKIEKKGKSASDNYEVENKNPLEGIYSFTLNGTKYTWESQSAKDTSFLACVDEKSKVYAKFFEGTLPTWNKGELHLKKDLSADLTYLIVAGALALHFENSLGHQTWMGR